MIFTQNIRTIGMFTLFLLICNLHAKPHSIQFGIPEVKIVSEIPLKDIDFAPLIPGNQATYPYQTEAAYYADYQRAYFALTYKKGGWDCLRHYEILANGCIPYFVDLEHCDQDTMTFLPKELILEAMHLPGVHYPTIDRTIFDEAKYRELLQKIVDHTRKHLTTESIARYFLKTIGYEGNGKVLFLSGPIGPDLQRDCLLLGLRQVLGDRLIDYPKVEFLYKNYAGDEHGRLFSVSKVLDDIPVDRSNVEIRLKRHEFDFVVYGSVHRGLPFVNMARATMNADRIVYVCGEDAHQCVHRSLPTMFLREFDSTYDWYEFKYIDHIKAISK